MGCIVIARAMMLSTSWNSRYMGSRGMDMAVLTTLLLLVVHLDDLLSCLLLSRIIAANTDLVLIGAPGPLRQLPCHLGEGCREGEDLFCRQNGSNSLQPRWDQRPCDVLPRK